MASTTVERSNFFLYASIFMLAAVVFAFGPTFYFRSLSARPTLPWHLYVHGAVQTAWFLLPVIQTGLIAKHRTDLHRRVGLAGGVLALAVITMGVVTSVWAVPRMKAAVNGPVRSDEEIALLVLGGLINVLFFLPLMLGIAFAHRDRPEIHKRWMYFSYVLMYGPVLSRMVQVWQAGPLSLIVSPVVGIVAIVIHDWQSLRRVHSATVWAAATFLASIAAAQGVARTRLGLECIGMLEYWVL